MSDSITKLNETYNNLLKEYVKVNKSIENYKKLINAQLENNKSIEELIPVLLDKAFIELQNQNISKNK